MRLSAETSVLLAVQETDREWFDEALTLIDAAMARALPVFVSLPEAATSLELPDEAVVARNGDDAWQESELPAVLRELSRAQVAVLATRFSGPASFTVIGALRAGYDVFLLLGGNGAPRIDDPDCVRLVQAGVAPVSIRQAALEWGLSLPDSI